jgi:hypothetical protein
VDAGRGRRDLRNIVGLVVIKWAERASARSGSPVTHKGNRTSKRILCTDYFMNKVAGCVSLSGDPQSADRTGLPRSEWPRAPLTVGGADAIARPLSACDISFISPSG